MHLHIFGILNLNFVLYKILKIAGWIAASLVLIGLVGFLFLNEKLPAGESSAEADALAEKMLQAINHEAYKETRYLEWTFSGNHHYLWDKTRQKVQVTWDDNRVLLDLNNPARSEVYREGNPVGGRQGSELIATARDYFNNDSFWLVAPHKVLDPGTERRLVRMGNGEEALLVTYTSGGSTPGDSYLWLLEENGLPRAFKMWVSILPIGGIEASWDHWKTTESGTLLPESHKVLFVEVKLENVRGWNTQ